MNLHLFRTNTYQYTRACLYKKFKENLLCNSFRSTWLLPSIHVSMHALGFFLPCFMFRKAVSDIDQESLWFCCWTCGEGVQF